METVNESFYLDKALKEIKESGFEEQRSRLLEADLYLAFSKHEKAMELLAYYDESSGQKVFSDLLENIQELLRLGEPISENIREEFFEIMKAVTSCCTDCRQSGSNGCYRWNILGQRYCEPC